MLVSLAMQLKVGLQVGLVVAQLAKILASNKKANLLLSRSTTVNV